MSKQFETQSFLGFLVLVSVIFLWLLKPFLGPIFWAVAIAIIFSPVRRWLQRQFPGKSNTTALLTLLVCAVIVIIPLIFTISSVVGQVAEFYQRVESGEIVLGNYFERLQQAFPSLPAWLERVGADIESIKKSVAEGAMAVGKGLAQRSLIFGQNTFAFALDIGVMLYVAFFFLRDGDSIVALLYRALPLGDARERLLFDKFAEVIRATVKGNLVVSLVQGTIGGVTFALLGIQAALLWGVVMAVASLLPAIGAAIVWVPVAIYLITTGDYVRAGILIAVGALVIGLIDNILRPILVGRDTKLPDYLILLSTLGGLVLFGINGFVIGPLIAALFIAFWGIFIREFQQNQADSFPDEIGEQPAREMPLKSESLD